MVPTSPLLCESWLIAASARSTAETIPRIPASTWSTTAKKLRLPLQYESVERGGTDAGPIHQWNLGVPTLDLVISQRYYHSANGIIHRDDYESAVRLITEIVKKFDNEKMDELMFKSLK